MFQDAFLVALDGLRPGDAVIVITWLHRAEREVLRVHSRDDPGNPERGVFTTRPADRPNPVRLHELEVVAVEGRRVLVRAARGGRRHAGARPQTGAPPAWSRLGHGRRHLRRPALARPGSRQLRLRDV